MSNGSPRGLQNHYVVDTFCDAAPGGGFGGANGAKIDQNGTKMRPKNEQNIKKMCTNFY